MYKLLEKRNDEYYAGLSDEEKDAVKKLADYISAHDGIKEQEIQQYLYGIINDPSLTKKENIARQQKFFAVFYNVLFGTDKGPRLYLFLSAIDKSQYLRLLTF